MVNKINAGLPQFYTAVVSLVPSARASVFLALVLSCVSRTLVAQSAATPNDVVRVTVSMNADGSKTTYEWDTANRKAAATTTTAEGKLMEKIRYVLDDTGRFQTGQVFGPDHALRFVTRYRYDAAGKLAEEHQFTKDGKFQHRVVHTYDNAGKEIGYSVYDANGKLLSQTAPPQPRASPKR
ncbi:MAG: hypothetical protein ACJ8KU_01195 [Chthoniobacterales bacterium]